MKEVVVVHYSELGTKGGNRRVFERKFADDVRRRLGPLALKVRLDSARVIAELAPGTDRSKISRILDPVFGLAWFAFGFLVPWSSENDGLSEAETAAVALARAEPAIRTFKIETRRSSKKFPHLSHAVCVRLGDAVVSATGLRVDVHTPDRTLYAEVLENEIAVLSHRVQGVRGLPQFSSGRMLCLFSGGIDSPVAAWLMMRRGAKVDLLHFHPYRSCDEVIGTKITKLFSVLAGFNPDLRLFIIPHDRYQTTASLSVPTSTETVFFRRFMFRAGEDMAKNLNYQALVTGDSLGQVASQTVENLMAVQTELSVPVFQPLIAYDKESIIALAKKIDVFDLALQPYKDCCSLLAKKPKTNVDTALIRRLEQELDMEKIILESYESAQLWDGQTLRSFPRGRFSKTIK